MPESSTEQPSDSTSPVPDSSPPNFLAKLKQSSAQASHQISRTLKTRRKGRKPFYRRPLLWVILILGGGAGAVGWGWSTLERDLPDVADVFTFVRDGTLTIKAADGRILQQRGPATYENLSIQKMPESLVQAFIAAEDHRFYQHTGVDYQGILRAVFSNVLARDVVEGGSTITQQLARIVFLNQEKTILRKLKEAMLAQKLERELTKAQILERYLNLVYLGSGAYGVTDAAWVYFSKPATELTLGEMAMIAGLPPAPSNYSPLVSPNAARQRRNIVLQRMLDADLITASEANAAMAEPLALKPSTPKRLNVEAPYFTSYIQQELPKYISAEDLEVGGLTIETTLNPEWQKIAEKAVREAVELDGRWQGFQEAALVAIDPRTGEVKALVGGSGFDKSQFNRATQAQRQPGSTFKAFVYAAAIATGQSPYDGYLDAQYKVDGYEPQNYGRTHRGWVSIRDALISSVNVVAVKALVDTGFDPIIQLAQRMGIKSELKPTYSLALGASEVNLLELTSAYGAFANKGKAVEAHGIRRVINRRGEVIYNADLKPKQAIDPVSAAITTWMLEGVVNSGTGSPAQLGRPVAGKTGTSENSRDLWFVGYIPQLVTGVWLGNDNNNPTWGSSGTAAFTWREFMARVVEGMPVEQFPELPALEGRKGSIKAKPVKPGSVVAGSGSSGGSRSRSDSYDSYDSGRDRGESYRPAAEPAYSPEPEPDYYSEPPRRERTEPPASSPPPAAASAPAEPESYPEPVEPLPPPLPPAAEPIAPLPPVPEPAAP